MSKRPPKSQPLTAYRTKRAFERSPEPQGGPKTAEAESPLRFVVQRHQARNLHYDFRLEVDGVLKSWAIPKGPSLDPQAKRLAVQVEDHPLEYRQFEGTIPKGNYGAGEVRIWDHGFYHSGQIASEERGKNIQIIRDGLANGRLDIVLAGEKLKGRFSLIKIKKSNDNGWLFIKHKDDNSISSPVDPMPRNIRPMLAQSVAEPFDRPDWFFELKWDGYRAIAEVDGAQVVFYSRRGLSFNQKYPKIVEALGHLKHRVVLDGEVVAIKDGKPDFHALQNAGESPAVLQYLVFDLLFLDGRDLRNAPLRERKELLQDVLPRSPALLVSEHVEGHGIAFYNQVEKLGMEGMVAKDAQSRYEEGRRSGAWVKVKIHNQQEALIVGFTAPRGARKRLGSLVLGVRQNGGIRFVGHSGGGFTEAKLEDLYNRLEKIKVPNSPFGEKIPINSPITWVKPELVCQIKFTEWTPDGRMRHPIFEGLREDKPPEEVVKEDAARPEEKPENRAGFAGHLKFTHLAKVFWPDEGYTKGDLISYYDSVAEVILPHLKDRPESLHRQPDGIVSEGFFHKDITIQLPSFIETVRVDSQSENKSITSILCQNRETLLYLANFGCIELNPWLSRFSTLGRPDFAVIDLDPGEASFDDLIVAARTVHEILDQACAESLCKTSGKSGLHILIPLGAEYDYDQSRMFSELIVRLVHKKLPKVTSIDRRPENRGGKVYLDHLQNRKGQTLAAPYSVRPCPGATISTPLAWDELGVSPAVFTIKTIPKRIEREGDLLRPLLSRKVNLAESLKIMADRAD